MKQTEVYDLPVSVQIDITTGEFSPCPEMVDRKVSDLAVMFYNQEVVNGIISSGDRLVYQIRYYPFITSNSDMALGTTIIFPGKVGDEFHMTKGHFHESDNQPEIYYCVQGEGLLQLENREGDYHAVPWKAGTITHIPPQYAHRVVNTGSIPLVFVASFHVAAGHDYQQVEAQGFKYVLVEREGKVIEISNPRRGG